MPIAHLADTLSAAVRNDRCALCGMPLSSHLAEVPCLHWFVMPGRRGFCVEQLARVFEVTDLATVLHYLRVLALAEVRPGEARSAYLQTVTGGITRTVIHWRRRSWHVEHEAADSATTGNVGSFELTTSYDGAVVDRARVALVGGERQVVVTPLVRRRRTLPAAGALA